MDTISFARGVPAPECLDEDELADCAREVVARDGKTILSYGAGNGYAPLREVIGEWHGVPSSQVLLTNGGLQGFVLLVQFLARGKSVFVELPTYDRPLKILNEVGSPIVTMAMDDDGLDPGRARQRAQGQPGARVRLHDPDLPEPERPHRPRGQAPRDRRARPGGRGHAARGRSLRPHPLRGHGAAVDVRARTGVGDLHLVVLEDDLAGPPGRLVHPSREPRARAHRASPTRPTSRPSRSARRSCTSSSAAGATSRTSSASTGC